MRKNIFVQRIPDKKKIKYNCDVCDRTIKNKSKRKHSKSVAHNESEKSSRLKHTIKNPNFFDVDENVSEYITSHNKKLDLYVVNYDFHSVFHKEFYPHKKSDLQNYLTKMHLKTCWVLWVE